MKALDLIVLARAREQAAEVKDWRRQSSTYPCPAPACRRRFSPQSKLKLCPVHSKIAYARQRKERKAK